MSHADAEVKSCPNCPSETTPFPETFCGSAQFGAGSKTYALTLRIDQMISLRRVQRSIQTLISPAIYEATILQYVLQLYLALARRRNRPSTGSSSSRRCLWREPSHRYSNGPVRPARCRHGVSSYAVLVVDNGRSPAPARRHGSCAETAHTTPARTSPSSASRPA